VLISIDTLRADHLGAYGYSRPTSPNLDRLAAGGVVFENARSTAPWTLPAHASLLTGLAPSRHGVRTPEHRLGADVPVLAEVLSDAGWTTAGVVNSRYLGRAFGLDRGFDHFEAIRPPAATEASSVESPARRWLEAHAGGAPFFLFVHFYDVHSDYGASPEIEALMAPGPAGGIRGRTEELQAVRRGDRQLDAADLERVVALYDAGIRQVDEAIGRLLETLDELGVSERTWVVVTSDHGEEFLEHGGVLHGRTHYRELLHVPLLWRGPGVPAGVRIEAPVSLVDVVPTVIAGLGLSDHPPVDGVDLAPLLAGSSPESGSGRYIVAEGDHGRNEDDTLRSIRGPRYALIHDRLSDRVELFDLRADPGESTDLAQARPEIRDELRRRLDDATTESRPASPRTPLSAREEAELRALGYLR
jgi:arylsulfatase A-like enzyme